jgi:DNA polymerase III gamma/tau subunit
MSLYNKYRPQSFDDLFGNKETIENLKKLIDKKQTHVFLFVGEAGIGKTTAARICAKELGSSPVSTIEINSSNNRGIDTARDIIDKMQYISMDGNCTVFIIDELHKTTNDWQNAMLKPLEDTPEHVYFFLCTTNPEKLIKPLKSRCSTFTFTPLSIPLTERLLKIIIRKEGIEIEQDVIEEIANNSNGIPRDALVMLESGISKNNLEEKAEVIDLCRALLNKETNWKTVTDLLKILQGEDIENIRWAVMGYMSSVLLNSKNLQAAKTLDYFSEPFYNNGRNGLILACFNSIF